MGRPMNEPPDDSDGKVHDLFAGKGGGQNRGVHRVMQLITKGDKGPHNTIKNLLVILAHDPPLARMVGFDDFTSQHLLLRAPPTIEDDAAGLPGPYPRPWGVADIALVQSYVQGVWITKATARDVETAMIATAEHNRFHPIRDWLASLKYDGKPRLNTWLHKAFGCPKDEYHNAISAKILIAAVRRIRQPGCKFDHLPVLEGPQGIGKSSVIKRLFGERWFSDAIPEELASRDAAMALLGVWALEFAEIQHLIRAEVEVIKAFLSRSTDRYRPPYAKAYVERPRQGVLIGTTNATDYLRDTSGNRRIWPIMCAFADVEWVTANRDQLWAEAAAREASGEAIWLDDTSVVEQAAEHQADRMAEDVWADRIQEWLRGRVEVRIPDVLTNALSIPAERQGKREEMRVASILQAEGWERRLERPPGGGKPRRFWSRVVRLL